MVIIIITVIALVSAVAIILDHRGNQPNCKDSHADDCKITEHFTRYLCCHRHDCDDVAATSLDTYYINTELIVSSTARSCLGSL